MKETQYFNIIIINLLQSLIIAKYESHSSIVNIKNSTTNKEHLDIPAAITDVTIIEELNPKNATGPDKIPPKMVKLPANIIDNSPYKHN